MKVLLVTPPMTNLTTPYPATAYLTGYLRSIGVEANQADWSLELACRLFSKQGLKRLRTNVRRYAHSNRIRRRYFLANYKRYRKTVEPVIRFLQGKDKSLEQRILSRKLLPEGRYLRQPFLGSKAASWTPRNLEALEDYDRARVMASLYLVDLGEVVDLVNPGFKLNSYAVGPAKCSCFDEMQTLLDGEKGSLLHELIMDMAAEEFEHYRPDVVGLTVPFPGSVAGALLVARAIKRVAPGIKIVLGGGYANTNLRELNEPRIFDSIDYITLDDGERPLACLLERDRPRF